MGGIAGITAKIKPLLSKAKNNKLLLVHSILVLGLFFLLIWQILNFYSLSSEDNISKAIKTKHMLVVDLKTGKALTYFPVAESISAHDETEIAKPAEPVAENNMAEISIILTGIGLDEQYSQDVLTLPPQYIFGFSPYGAKSTINSLKKAREGGYIAAQLNVDGGSKFDVTANANNFKNTNNINAAISKIYDPAALVLFSSSEFALSSRIGNIADIVAEKQIVLVTTHALPEPRRNVVSAHMYIPSGTPHDQVLGRLIELENIALEKGYALAVIDSIPGIRNILDVWTKDLAAKKIKLSPVVK